MDKKFLTTGEIAKLCGVNFRTVIRWTERGELKAYQLPGRGDNRVTKEDFLRFLKIYKLPIPEEFSFNPKRILIVEDDINLAKSLERTFKQKGFETMIAKDGFNAGIMAASFLPKLITLDLKMEGMGGMDVLKLIRNHETLKQVKIIVISGLHKKELIKAQKAGADAILEKPFKTEILLKKVHELLEISEPA